MKKAWVFIFCLTLGSIQAQIDLGVKAGVNAPGIRLENFKTSAGAIEELQSPDRHFGFHLGAFAKINALLLFIQPEVLYTNLNANVHALEAGNKQNLNLNFHRLDIPVLIGKKIGPVRLMVAPVYSINLDSSNEISRDDLEAGSFGYQAGVGVEFGKFHVDLKYEGHFSETARSIIINETPYTADMRVNQLILSMGFDLL